MITLAATANRDLSLLGVLGTVGFLLVLAYRLRIPYPILLVVGGAGIGFVPGTPDVRISPDIVLIAFLPPLLYSAAFFSSLRDLRDNLQEISMLAVGCVLFTTCLVAVIAHAVVSGMGWAPAFVLGAVVSPTDAVSATAIAGRIGAPQRYTTVVEGESLVNDATALIAYRFAIAAVVTGGFSAFDAGWHFILNAVAGIAIGLVVGRIITTVRRMIDDPPIEITISLITPYLAYLPAEAFHVSAVLAAVTAGIFLGWRSPELITPATRLQAFAVWEILVFVLNAVLFVILGLELPTVLHDASRGVSTSAFLVDATVVSAAVIVLRAIWIFPVRYLNRMLSRRVRDRDPQPSWQEPALLAWTGMRGAISLAAALAIPLTVHGGGPFPDRALIIALTYAVILATLLLQGLSLPYLIGALDIEEDGSVAEREAKARLHASQAAIDRIDELLDEDWVREQSAERMRKSYEFRIRRFGARFDDEDDGEIERGSLAFQRLRREVLQAERREIIRLRNTGKINDEIMHRIERDIDLEDTRLEI